ncbi:MAG: helix-turn-helix domain-containing protein [Phycisphaerales bacterium]|nr:helix-turn-helix domain-containing protein [Phycisphaerales bacterium]
MRKERMNSAVSDHEADRLVPVETVAELLGVSTRTVWRMRDSGELPRPIRVSRSLLRWRLSEIVRYMRSGAMSA